MQQMWTVIQYHGLTHLQIVVKSTEQVGSSGRRRRTGTSTSTWCDTALPCASAAFSAKTAHLPCASAAFSAKTAHLPCVSAAFVSKTLPFLADCQHAADGACLGALTAGNFVVDGIVSVDEANGDIYFLGSLMPVPTLPSAQQPLPPLTTVENRNGEWRSTDTVSLPLCRALPPRPLETEEQGLRRIVGGHQQH